MIKDDDPNFISIEVGQEDAARAVFLKLLKGHIGVIADNLPDLAVVAAGKYPDLSPQEQAGFVHAAICQAAVRAVFRYIETISPLYEAPPTELMRMLVSRAVQAELAARDAKESAPAFHVKQ